MNVSSTCYILLFRVCIKANLKRTDSKDLNNGPINNGTIQIMDIYHLKSGYTKTSWSWGSIHTLLFINSEVVGSNPAWTFFFCKNNLSTVTHRLCPPVRRDELFLTNSNSYILCYIYILSTIQMPFASEYLICLLSNPDCICVKKLYFPWSLGSRFTKLYYHSFLY